MTKRPISVLYFTNGAVRGGAEEHILTLVRGLDRNLFRPHLVCPQELAEKLRSDLPADVDPIPLCLRKPSQVGTGLELARMLRELRVDVLHSHLFYSSLFASPIGWLCRVPVIVETPHVREEWRRGWLKSRFVVDRCVGRFVDYYIAVSEANARYLVHEKGLPAEKIVVIHNGRNLHQFDPDHSPPNSLRQSLGFDSNDPVLVVMARLEPQKGHSALLRALALVRREFPRVRLVCLGDGRLRGQLEEQVRALGVKDSVRFVGYQTNVADWLALADLTVLPSFYEGLPLVAIESLAAGRPVVATAVDGTPEVVLNGKTGLTVPPGDARRLAEAICYLLRDVELRRALGRAGRQWVLERFSEEQQIKRTEELYLRAWEQHRRTPDARESFAQAEVRPEHKTTPDGGAVDLDAKTTVTARAQPTWPQPHRPQPDGISTFRTAIPEETAQAVLQQYGHELRAIVLTGSLARDEATFTEEAGHSRLLGDAEFLLIFEERAGLPGAAALAALRRTVEDALLRLGLQCRVGLSPVHPSYLRKLRPHIFAYELRVCGQIVWGDPQILDLIPVFSFSDIPLEDAWRLLLNRMIEMLECADRLLEQPKSLPRDVFYRTAKLYLDMATSFLLFANEYAPTYRERAEKLAKLVENGVPEEQYPFPLARFAERVRGCTEIKLNGTNAGDSYTTGQTDFTLAVWEEAVAYACLLWRWELAQLTGTRAQATNQELLKRWMRLQPRHQRLRGWLSLLRRCGWRRSLRLWARWLPRIWQASPRYWIYGAASELFTRLPCLLDGTNQSLATNQVDWHQLESWLPVPSDSKHDGDSPAWQRLAAGILRNYSEFLAGTRA